jgi:hypothetical protein
MRVGLLEADSEAATCDSPIVSLNMLAIVLAGTLTFPGAEAISAPRLVHGAPPQQASAVRMNPAV